MRNKELLLIIFLILISIISGCIVKTEVKNIQLNPTFVDSVLPVVELNIKEVVLPIPIYTHKPIYKPILRVYEIDKSSDIWHAKDSSSYITPNNEWIQYYADKVKNNEGIFLYYKTDKELYPYAPNEDMWQNADYTAYTQEGDCEDLSILWVSIHRALGHEAIVVGGYLEDNQNKRIRDFWYEYISEYGHHTKIVSESAMMDEYKLIPVYMFNDKVQWSSYNENWYK